MIIIKNDINKVLISLLGKWIYVDKWWESPNKAFDNRTPNTVYYSGEEGRKRVYAYVMTQVNGDYS
jgi:hypothetical protein